MIYTVVHKPIIQKSTSDTHFCTLSHLRHVQYYFTFLLYSIRAFSEHETWSWLQAERGFEGASRAVSFVFYKLCGTLVQLYGTCYDLCIITVKNILTLSGRSKLDSWRLHMLAGGDWLYPYERTQEHLKNLLCQLLCCLDKARSLSLRDSWLI